MNLELAVVVVVGVAVVAVVSADDAVIYCSLPTTIRCSNCCERLYWQNDLESVDTD